MMGRLVIVCGLPGAGETTVAAILERQLHAVRFSAGNWMIWLGIDLFNAPTKDAIEDVQHLLTERLLRLGDRGASSGVAGAGRNAIASGKRDVRPVRPSSCTSPRPRRGAVQERPSAGTRATADSRALT